jgi:CopG family nickel-responsive transcriptional regulator
MLPVIRPDSGPPIAPANIIPTWKKCIRNPIANGTDTKLRTTVSPLNAAVNIAARLENFMLILFPLIVILRVLKTAELLLLTIRVNSRLAGVERISVSVPPGVLRQFDDVLGQIGYSDRSKALHAAMRNFVAEYSWTSSKEALAVGAILITYNYRSHGVQDTLTEIQHRYRDVISSNSHVHIDEVRCLEMISVKGPTGKIQELARSLMKRRGVTQLKLAIVGF